MNPIDYIGANVSAEELELMDFDERDAAEESQSSTHVQVVDDLLSEEI